MIKSRPVLSFVLLTYLISWLFWLPGLLAQAGVWVWDFDPSLYTFIGALGPLISVLLVSYIDEGVSRLKDRIHSIFQVRGKIWWIAGALVFPWLLVLLISLMISMGTGVFPSFGNRIIFSNTSIYLVYTILVLAALAEETGWRGYLQAEIQQIFHPLLATLFVTLIWLGWHLPTFWFYPISLNSFKQMGLLAIGPLLFSFIVQAIIYAWLWNRSRSVLAVGLLHAGFNLGSSFTSQEVAGLFILVWVLFAVVIAITSRGRLGTSQQPSPNNIIGRY